MLAAFIRLFYFVVYNAPYYEHRYFVFFNKFIIFISPSVILRLFSFVLLGLLKVIKSLVDL